MSAAAWIVPLSLVGGYAVLSVVLLRFPLLIHRRKQTKINARLIAHRGGAGENLENTITAYEHAVKSGMDMLELDCQMTKDGEVVVAHDNYLGRITGINSKISDVNYKDLPLISKQLAVHFCKGETVCGNENDRKIPLLKEVFDKFGGVAINLDIKRDDDKLIHKVIDMILDYKREDITAVGNFSEAVVQKCHQLAPQIPTIMSRSTSVKMLVAFYFGFLPFLDFEEEFLEIPMGRELIKSFGVEKRWVKVLIWMLDFFLVNRVLFRHLQRRGIKVYVWVLNNEAQWDRAMSKGVDGIMTDYPAKLAEYMRKDGRWLAEDKTPQSNGAYDALTSGGDN